MDKEVGARKPHVLVIPFPSQGHINPSLAFAKYLGSKGLLVTVITTTSVSKSAKFSDCSSITIDNISDGSEEVKEPETIEGYFKRLQCVLSENLAKFIDKQKSSSDCPPKLIIYDSVMPWVLEIAHGRGLLAAAFFTQSLAVSAIFYHLKQGSLKSPYEDSITSLPSLPTLEKKDLPSFPHAVDLEQIVVRILADQFSNIEKADWIFFNTFDNLESEIIEWMASRLPIKTIGPTFLLLQNDENFSNMNHTISLFEPKYDACREWLNLRETGSVVYVSFGSIASLGKEQMDELAYGLISCDCYFLWVVRSSEINKLPQDFTSSASEKGLIVEWCHQPQVLAHRALACFVTHCGWNSTLEALSRGVPLIAMAQWVDQNTNSKFIEDVWRVGIEVKPGEDEIISREEIAMFIKQVVNGDEGIELKKNACMWKKLANEAVGKGGTSANNIEEFVSKLICS